MVAEATLKSRQRNNRKLICTRCLGSAFVFTKSCGEEIGRH